MPWPLKFIANPKRDKNGNIDIHVMSIGDCWFLNPPTHLTEQELAEWWRCRHLTDQYYSDNSKRPPLVILLPGKTYFVADSKCFSLEKGYYDGWKVVGDPANLTIAPSVNFKGAYHGYITNGIIGNDVEGRKFS